MILFSLQESKFFLSSHHFFVAIAVNTQTALRQLLQILPLPRVMLPPKCWLVGWLSLFQRFFPIVALAILCCCRCHCMVAAVPYEDASAARSKAPLHCAALADVSQLPPVETFYYSAGCKLAIPIVVTAHCAVIAVAEIAAVHCCWLCITVHAKLLSPVADCCPLHTFMISSCRPWWFTLLCGASCCQYRCHHCTATLSNSTLLSHARDAGS